MKDWMVKFSSYVADADTDDLPLEKNMNMTAANISTPVLGI